MTSTDIVRIIKACKDVGLKYLEYNGLILKFEEDMEDSAITWQPSIPRTMNLVDNIEEMTHNDFIPPLENEDEDELIKLEDPLEWERQQVNNG